MPSAQPSFGLNPLAPAFVPTSQRKVDLEYTGWGKDGRSGRQQQPRLSPNPPGEPGGCSWRNLPKEVVAAILSKLRDPADVLAVALTCKMTLQAAGDAPLALRAASLPHHNLSNFLLAAPSMFQAMSELSLAGCATLEDDALLAALRQMPWLKVLDVSGCRKLSPTFPRHALAAAAYCSEIGLGVQTSGLQSLGLQRCFQLRAAALSDILQAAAGQKSHLEAVALSHLSLGNWPADELSARHCPRMPAAHSVPCGALKVLALHNCSDLAPDGLAYLAASCPDLEMLMLGGSSLAVPLPCLDSSETSRNYFQRVAAALAEPCQGLAKLQVLEVTFHDRATIKAVSAALPGVQVWDFTQQASLNAAAERAKKGGSGLSLALAAAVNCSSSGRYTPLHISVLTDSPASIPVLLELGAHIEARDHSGATPLFRGCETDKLACVRLLLAAGAEIRTRNSGGEAPLYIAALRGHGEVLQELLAAFRWRDVKWTESDLYGDQWNPLMAAAVADRHGIALRLLRAAGHEAASLAVATNRYGQSAAHIAARKGSHVMLHALLNAAGNIVATIPDNDHNTPLEIAVAHKHDMAARMLGAAHAAFAAETAQPTGALTQRVGTHAARQRRAVARSSRR